MQAIPDFSVHDTGLSVETRLQKNMKSCRNPQFEKNIAWI
jgi:hypothetical protein